MMPVDGEEVLLVGKTGIAVTAAYWVFGRFIKMYREFRDTKLEAARDARNDKEDEALSALRRAEMKRLRDEADEYRAIANAANKERNEVISSFGELRGEMKALTAHVVRLESYIASLEGIIKTFVKDAKV